jgi:hypothetical protein
MPTNDHARESSEQSILDDAKAMAAAALADAPVHKRLGDAYLKRVDTAIADAQSLVAGKGTIAHAKIAEGTHVHALAEQLLDVMRDIRDSVKLAGESAEAQSAFGVGADWKASSPTLLVTAAHGLEAAFLANPKVAKEAQIDLQHRHDLTQLAGAIDAAHAHHRTLAQDRTDDTAARALAFETLRGMAHHIRLAANLVHRNDAVKRQHFVSPIPQHVVEHHAAAPASPPTGTKASS